MNNRIVWAALTFVFGLITASVGGTTYLHVAFASKDYVREVKKDIFEKLNSMDRKLDRLIESRKEGQ